MRLCSRRQASNDGLAQTRMLITALFAMSTFQTVEAYQRRPLFYRGWQKDFLRHAPVSSLSQRGPPRDNEERVPLKITNKCDATIWPGIATQAGAGPGTGGFELSSNNSTELWVSPDWQGRVWGRTNCTVNDDSCSCETGDCFGLLDCEFSVSQVKDFLEVSLQNYGLQRLGGNTGNFGRVYACWRCSRHANLL